MNMDIRATLETGILDSSFFLKKSKKILIVNDVDWCNELDLAALETLDGVDLLTAQNEREALPIIEAECPDLVFLDFYRAGMDGSAGCHCIQEKCSPMNIPVVMVTRGEKEEAGRDCLGPDCDPMQPKPANHSLLTAMAKKYLNLNSRVFQRYVVNLKIHYGVDMLTNLTDYCVNLSQGGLFLATTNILPIDTQLSVEFTLPDQALPVVCLAKVVWINGPEVQINQHLPPGMGLCFLDMTLEGLHAVREYLSAGGLTPVW